MAQFQTVARLGDIPEGEGRAFLVGDRMVAVFLTDGVYSAMDDTCPHLGASLSSGSVEQGAVVCPWHAWRFCVHDGTWIDNPGSSLRLAQFEVRIVQNEIQVLVPGEEQ